MRASGARHALARNWKHLRQRLQPRYGAGAVVFVVGAQRSGTTMLLDALDAHRDTRIHHEHDRTAFDDTWRLRPYAERRRLVEGARCRWVVWKPLLDFQHLDRLLEVHPGSRAVFLLRDPRDVARSSVEKWGESMLQVVRRIATQDACTHWMAERLPAERRDELASMAHEGLDPVSAAALRWWLRNQIFFDLALDTREHEVMPVRYETLVREPDATLDGIFAFLDLAFAEGASRHVVADRVGRGRDATLDPVVAERCRALETRLDAVIAARGKP
jgi:hypothetical protein